MFVVSIVATVCLYTDGERWLYPAYNPAQGPIHSICSWPDGSLIRYDWLSQTIAFTGNHVESPRLLQ